MSSNNQNSTPSTSGSASIFSNEDKSAEKRRAIQSILKDATLTDLERRLKIQTLMDGSSNSNNAQISAPRVGARGMVSSLLGSSTATGDSSSAVPRAPAASSSEQRGEEVVSCVHYERKCNMIAPCCGKEFGCRVCHDEMSSSACGTMDRFAVTEIVCKECNTRQSNK
jgi:hypothetical protein